MARSCTICRGKIKYRCDKCGNDFCQIHAIKCHSCGTITCIRDLGMNTACPVCDEEMGICPDCLVEGNIVRTIADLNQCPECGWNYQT